MSDEIPSGSAALQIGFFSEDCAPMTALRFSLAILSVLALTGMARKPTLTVRFHLETNGAAGPPFAVPVKFTNPPREGFMSNVPAVSERNILAIFPTPAPDGTWGCAFKLDPAGRIAVETMSRESRGSSLVAFISTKGGSHQVMDLIVDRPVSDGILYLPRGLTPLEIAALRKKFKVLGETGKKEREKKPAPSS